MISRGLQAGFSAVELLITLFIAAAFLGTGYQLYSIIAKNGGEVRLRAKASNIAYDNLRKYASLTSSPCVSSNPTATIPANSGLPSPTITVNLTCPYGTTVSVTKVQVLVRYGSPQQEVIHAMYTN